jgi:hypothetical protein
MNPFPPLNDAILMGLAQLVDDAQSTRRDPSHEQIGFCIEKAGLRNLDPQTLGQQVGKAKRVRAVLSQAMEIDFESAQKLTTVLISHIRGLGGFRITSPNYVGDDPLRNLQAAFITEGFVLADNGELSPQVLENLSGAALTDALAAYTRRAQKGADDAALVTGTGKDLVEATAAHVLIEVWNSPNPPHNFPTLLGQAFAALSLRTSANNEDQSESPQQSLQRALFDAACAVNRLRNKQGTGHGRPWLPTVSDEEARTAVQTMGIVAEMLLAALRQRKS